jgi:hypothetical protein
MRKLADRLSQPMPRYLLKTRFPYKADLAGCLNLAAELPETTLDLQIINPQAIELSVDKIPYANNYKLVSAAYHNSNESLPKVFVVHDSFADFLKPYLAECASFSQFYIRQNFSPTEVLAQRPDVLIEELAERNLYGADPLHVSESVNVIANSCNSRATLCDATGRAILANFGDTTDLINLAARTSSDGMTVRMLWRNRVTRVRNNQINVFTLASDGKECAVNYYLPDPYSSTVQTGAEWVDIIKIPESSLKGATQLGIMLCDKKGAMSCRGRRTDVSSPRILIPIRESLENWDAFQKSYRFSPTS